MKLPAAQMEKLLREEKWEEIGTLLKVYFEDTSEGGDKLDAVRAYVRLKTKLTEDYNKKLDSLIVEAEKAVAAGKKLDVAEKN